MPPKRRTEKDAGLLAGSDRTDAHFAATAGRSDLLEEAMEQNIDLSHADKDGMTALHCACARSARGCVRLLLGVLNDEKRSHALRVDEAWVDARDRQGRTALHHASIRGDPSIVEMLVAAGADPASTSKANKTPADLAGSSGAFAALAAATRAVDRRERFEGAALRSHVARAKAPGGVFALLEAARREEAELAAETAMLDSLHREAEERVLLQRQLNMEAAAEKKQLERRETRRRLRAEKKAAQEALLSDKLDAGITAAASEPPALESAGDE